MEPYTQHPTFHPTETKHDVQTTDQAQGRREYRPGEQIAGAKREQREVEQNLEAAELWCSWAGTSWSKGPDHGWSRGRRLSRGRRRINADRRAGGGEEVARLRARSGRRDAATAQDRRDAAAALRELEAAAATLAARSGGRGATIAARVGAITVGEGVFRR
jgi:hypothetical protein